MKSDLSLQDKRVPCSVASSLSRFFAKPSSKIRHIPLNFSSLHFNYFFRQLSPLYQICVVHVSGPDVTPEPGGVITSGFASLHLGVEPSDLFEILLLLRYSSPYRTATPATFLSRKAGMKMNK